MFIGFDDVQKTCETLSGLVLLFPGAIEGFQFQEGRRSMDGRPDGDGAASTERRRLPLMARGKRRLFWT